MLSSLRAAMHHADGVRRQGGAQAHVQKNTFDVRFVSGHRLLVLPKIVAISPLPCCRRLERRPQVAVREKKIAFLFSLRFAPRIPSAERRGNYPRSYGTTESRCPDTNWQVQILLL